MRLIARQGVRLARSSSKAEGCVYTRSFPARNIRKLHGSFRTSSEPRGFSGHHDHRNSLDTHHEERDTREEHTATAERDVNVSDSQPATDTPTAKRTLRQRRIAANIPKPPPVPEWFLQQNVKLQSESIKPDCSGAHARTVICADGTDGRTLLVFPYYEAYADYLDNDTNGRPTEDLAKGFELVKAWNEARVNPKASRWRAELGAVAETVDPTHFIPKYSQEAYYRAGYGNLLRWTLLEIESGVRAAFALPGKAQSASTHAASDIDISLLCPHSGSHARLDQFIDDLANLTGADLVRLDANDLADLTSEYVGQGSDSPGGFSTFGYDVFDGYTSTDSGFGRPAEQVDNDEFDEDTTYSDGAKLPGINLGNPMNWEELRRSLHENRHKLAKALGNIPIQGYAIASVPGGTPLKPALSTSASQPANSSNSVSWDQARLRTLLDSLLEAPRLKRASIAEKGTTEVEHYPTPTLSTADKSEIHDAWRIRRSQPGYWFPGVAGLLISHVDYLGVSTAERPRLLRFSQAPSATLDDISSQKRRTLVHVRDLLDICQSPVGTAIIRRLIHVVQSRRRAGEEIFLVGTSGQEAQGLVMNGQQEHETLPLRHLVVPPYFVTPPSQSATHRLSVPAESHREKGYHRILEINLRHLQSMLRQLRPAEEHDLLAKSSLQLLNIKGTQVLSEQVLPFEQVHRIVLTAIGLSQVHAFSEHISPLHIGLATLITSRADEVVDQWSAGVQVAAKNTSGEPTTTEGGSASSNADKARARMDDLKKRCNPHESRLLSGVVDPDNITTSFDGVHAPAETIEALKTLTSLSLVRPDAFRYGVLANDRLPGLMLYGPPGTGKTMLAKAVAKESRATVLEISGAQIYEKYVGEGEKMVRAVFSLAKKLSPCIVFIDEADSIFGARKSAGSRNTHREIINQFLREWDGMDAHNIFIMIASNRPFDLDDAVLRRVPRRLLVDLPVSKDRESILGIHLKGECLDESVSLSTLAEQTPLYSGSDLKNICVAAALACVREENDLLKKNKDEEGFKLPERRTLTSRHFEQAMREISASISEDMDSLTAIRKFDEQYGDRRGRRKKSEYGFGLGGQDGVDEYAARVRQNTPLRP